MEDSLRRLKVDVIDLYQIHWPQPDEDVEEGWAALAELKREGKARWIGVSNFNKQQLERAQTIAAVETLQPPYSLVAREIEQEAFPYCQAHNIGVIVYSPMKSGLLSGKMTRERIATPGRRLAPCESALPGAGALAEPGRSRAAEAGRGALRASSAGAVAVAWTLA